jgi:hypothetical protein
MRIWRTKKYYSEACGLSSELIMALKYHDLKEWYYKTAPVNE